MARGKNCTELSYDTPSGIFQSDDCQVYWIIDSGYEDRYAVQLTSSEIMPQFGYVSLSAEVIATGRWVCDVRLKIRKKREESMPEACGSILHRRRRLYLNANNNCGRGAYLFIKGYDVAAVEYSRSHYPDWELVTDEGSAEIIVFAAPTRLPRLRNYGEQVNHRHVEWC